MEDEKGKKVCNDEVVDNIVSQVVAGYESTSNAIMSPLALHKLREENDAVSRDKNGGFISLDDIPSMKYTAKEVASTIVDRQPASPSRSGCMMIHSASTQADGTCELLNPNAEVTYLPHSKPVDGAAMSFSKLNSV
ncbi:unnamed protein product [Miscanthus lutarioriparius]|uniref:Uncharacterized protein n=1 Tax=Miscanthus lutarioriparius TaxID=422564 RepID=A0A811SEQ0_9POAL|nr:unnamed protein product [Miscanthus lutarioriparius]